MRFPSRRFVQTVAVWVMALLVTQSLGLDSRRSAAEAAPVTPAGVTQDAPVQGRSLADALALLTPVSPDEVVALRTVNSRTFRTEKGYRVELHAGRLYYQKQPGVYETIDNTLVPVADGEFALRNKANSWEVRFTDQPGKNRVRFDLQGRWFSFDLNEETANGASGFHAQASGSRVTYTTPGAAADLEYDVTSGGAKESILLHRYSGKSSWTFHLQTQGFVPTQMSDGHIGLMYDSSVTEEAASLEPVIAVDAAGARIDGTLTLASQQDGSHMVVVAVDPTWLAAPSRKYPVVIDPSVQIATSGGSSMWTVLDQSSSTPYTGNLIELRGDDTVRGLVKFDLRAMDRGVLAANQLESAQLVTRVDRADSSCSGTDCRAVWTVTPLAQDWFAASATWDRPRWNKTSWNGGDPCTATKCPGMPANALSFTKDVPTAWSGTIDKPSLAMDVTAAVQRMLDGTSPNYGFMMSLDDKYASTNDLYLWAKDAYGESYYEPELSLNFVADLTKPTVSLSAPADGSILPTVPGPGPVTVTVSAWDAVDGGGSGRMSRVELLVDNNVAGYVQTDVGSNSFAFDLYPSRYIAGHHQLQARAYDSAGNHMESGAIDVFFRGGLVGAPANLRVRPQSSTVNDLTWAPAIVMAATPEDPAPTVTYTIDRSAYPDFRSYTTLASGVSGTTYADTAGGTTYYYRVRAVSDFDQGVSDYSNVALPHAPGASAGLSGVGQAGGAVDLSWHPSADAYSDPGITSSLYRDGVAVATGLTGLTWTDAATVPGTVYTYQVSAVNAAGQASGKSAPFTITASMAAAPEAVTGMSAVSQRNRMVSLRWDGNQSDLTFNIYRSADRNADPETWPQVAAGISGWFYNDLNLTEGVTYYYYVKAASGGQEGPRSAIAGAMAADGLRLGVDSRWPTTSFAAGDGTGYLNLATGNLAFSATDSVVPAPYLTVALTRYYNAQGGRGGTLGAQWRLNADWRVEDYGSYAVLTSGDGGEHLYTFDGTVYHGDALWYWSLTRDAGGLFMLTRSDRVQYHFDDGGRLSYIEERNGNRISYHYDSQNRLDRITDPVQRTTVLTYDPVWGRLTRITDGANRSVQYAYDDHDRLVAVTNPDGGVTTYQYDGNGRLTYAATPAGRWTAWTYDEAGRVSSVTGIAGEQSTVSYATATTGGGTTDLTYAQTDTATGTTRFAYDNHGFLTELTDAEQYGQAAPKKWTYAYAYQPADPTKLDHMVITNPLGLQTRLTYDSMGNVTQSLDSGTDLTAPGVTTRVTTLSYLDGSSDLAQVTDAATHTTTQVWSTSAPYRLFAVEDPLSHLTQYTYSTDPAQPGWITGVTDPNNQTASYGYDEWGNLTSVTRMVSGQTLTQTMTYNADGSIASLSDLHDINATTYPTTHTDYDAIGRKVRVTYPDGSMEAWVYDPDGLVTVHTDRAGMRQTYRYDQGGRITAALDHAGNATTYAYDRGDNVTAITDPLGNHTTYTYDRLHRVTREERPDGMTLVRSYDAVGDVVSLASGDKTVVDTAGHTVTATYYPTGLTRQIAEVLPSSAILLADGTHPAGQTAANTQTYQYNAVGQVTQSQDAAGMITSYAYDDAGRLHTVTDAAAGVTEYGYDANGNQTDVWDAEHTKAEGYSSTHATYDELNRVISIRDPLGNTTSQTYDDAGNLASRTEPRTKGSLTVTYGYDAGHRVTSITYPNMTGTGPVSPVEYVYDGGGRRLLRRDEWGIAKYSYDSLGRLQRVVSPQENTSYEYDADGNPTAISYSLGKVMYSYDAGRMKSVTDPLGNVTTYSYDLYGHVSQVQLPGGTNPMQRTYSYYAMPNGALTNRVKSIANKSKSGSTTYWAGTYQYDYTGNVRDIAVTWNQRPNTYALTATYDNLYRLVQWKDTSITDTDHQTFYYAYDADGDRLQWGNVNNGGQIQWVTPAGNMVSQNATYDAANRVATQSTAMRDNWQQLTGTARYEPNGNDEQNEYWYDGSTSTRDANQHMYYDDADRLVEYLGELHDSAQGWLDRENYSYDGDGRRIDWMAQMYVPWPSDFSIYLYAYKQYEYVGDDVVAERAENGEIPVWYVYGAGGEKLYTLHWDDDALTVDAYAKDHLGSVTEVVRSDGTTANSYQYDAFGLPQSTNTTLANSYQFASAPIDTVYRSSTDGYSSFYNLKARMYNPQVGRFLTQDTYKGNPWQPWTQNLYVYVGNNPVNYVDPTGHSAQMNATAETGGGAQNTTSPDSNPSTPSLAAAALAFGGKLILIDENMNASGLADELRQLGYNIITMKEAGLPVGTGYPDPKIIEWAKQNQAYILTQNVKDFKKAYDLVIGSKNGWTVQEITARMSALQRQYSAAPDSLKWLTYVSLMEDGFLRRILSIPLFAPFDPSTGCMFGPAPVDGVQLVPGCGPKMDN